MYKIVKLNSRQVKGNSNCKVCPSPFEFIDYINGESVVADINQLNIASENIMILKTCKEFITKENVKQECIYNLREV